MNQQAFFLAIQQGHPDEVSKGIKLGFTAETMDASGKSALDLALGLGYQDIIDLLMLSPDIAHDKTTAMLDNVVGGALPAAQAEPIAVVGMSCRFAKDAEHLSGFWESLRQQTETTSIIPSNRFVNKAAFAEARKHPASYLKNDLGLFDADFFRINAQEAALMDPQQRMLLEETYHAFEQGGFDLHALSGQQVGVYVGQMTHDYMDMMRADSDEGNARLATGTIGSVLSGRISYLYDFLGEALTLNTACSSSLVGIHVALNSLRSRQVDMALVAGVNAIIDPRLMLTAAQAGMTSPEGKCHAFSEQAKGYGRGEGVGVVLLKRLSDAQRDGDHIQAIMLGSAVNQDGKSSQLTAPQKSQQIAVINDALKSSGLQASDIDVVEAHGTGTILGDQIEISALSAVFGQRKANAPALAVRSVKSNIGHCEAAAGIASVIKTVLALQHGEIPGQARLTKLSSRLELNDTLQIKRETQSWPQRTDRVRRAGISSFGFSGTNAHLVLAEASPSVLNHQQILAHQWQGLSAYPVPQQASLIDKSQLFVVSARSKEALAQMLKDYQQLLEKSVYTLQDLANVAYTATLGRTHQPHRIAIIFNSQEHLLAQLANPTPIAANAEYQLSNLSAEQCQAMLAWYRQDVYLQSIVAGSNLTAEELLSMQQDPLRWSKQQTNLYSFILLYAAAIRYQHSGLTLRMTQVSGIGAHVWHAIQDKTSMQKILDDLRLGALQVENAEALASSIGNGYIVSFR